MIALVTKLDTWTKNRRLVVFRVLKPTNDSLQLSFLKSDEFEFLIPRRLQKKRLLLTKNAAIMKIEEIILIFREFSQNHHPTEVKMW